MSVQYVAVMGNLNGDGRLGVSVNGPFDSRLDAIVYAEWRRSLGHCQWAGWDLLGAPEAYSIDKWREQANV